PQPRAAARRRADLERAAEVGEPLAHALQAEGAHLGEVLWPDAAAVVLDVDMQVAVLHRENQPGVLRAGVARDVGERFLRRAVDRGRYALRDALQCFGVREPQVALDARALGEVLHQP